MTEGLSRKAALILAACIMLAAGCFLLLRYPLRSTYPQDGVAAYLETLGGEKLDLNAADETALASLPGIGAVKAKAITEYRDGCGGFSCVEQLLEVPGIGPATLEKLRELVTVQLSENDEGG